MGLALSAVTLSALITDIIGTLAVAASLTVFGWVVFAIEIVFLISTVLYMITLCEDYQDYINGDAAAGEKLVNEVMIFAASTLACMCVLKILQAFGIDVCAWINSKMYKPGAGGTGGAGGSSEGSANGTENAGGETSTGMSGSKTYTVDPAMQAKDIEMGVLVDGSYIKNPTAQNMSDLIKPGSNYVGNSKMNGQFMYVVDMNGNIIIGSRAGQYMPHPTLIGGTNPTVQGAGIVEIRGGKIYSIDNASGHFKPDDSCMTNVQSAFEQLPSNVFHKNFQGYLTYVD